MRQEQLRRDTQRQEDEIDEIVEQEIEARTEAEEEILSETDRLLNEIDLILMDDAETFVAEFQQRGGQ